MTTPSSPSSDRAVFQFAVSIGASLRDVMLTLEVGAEIALVVEGNLLVGVMTDGDVRRALLAGATLDSPVKDRVRRDCITVGPNAGRAEVLELMQARFIGQIPIVDAHRRLLGLHRLHDIIGVAERENWAVIMAGGKGTRLGALTANTPKPMLRVAGRPILERIILHLVGHGIRRIFVAVSYLADKIREHFGDGSAMGVNIEYLHEMHVAGTGGALALLPESPTAPILVMNGDLVTQANLGAMLDHHGASGASATMAVRRYLHVVPFGCVEVKGDAIVQIEEKPTLSHLVNAGVYVLEPALVARIPRGVEYPITTLFEECLRRDEKVSAFEIVDDWIDVGQHDQLRQARGES